MIKSQTISHDTLKRLEETAYQEGCTVDKLINNLLDEPRQTSPHLTIALNSIADAVIATDIELRVTAWNKGAEIIYGWTESEAIGKAVDELLNTVWINEDQLEAQSTLMESGYWDGEIEQTHCNGQKRSIWAVVSFIMNPDDEIIGAVTVNRDITKNKITREALHDSEKRHKTLLSAIPDLIVRNRLDGTYLDFHALDADDFYIPPSEFMGKTVYDVLPESLANDVMPILQQVITTGESSVYEYELVGRYFEMRVVQSGMDEALSMVRDITDTRLAQKRELEFALEKDRLELLTMFIRNTAHEFRTPLSTISTNAYLISRYDDSELLAKKTQQINVQVNRIAKLVDMSLMMAKLEDLGKSNSIINIQNVIQHLCDTMRVQYGDTPQLSYELSLGSPMVSGNPDYLVDALRQLFDNAYRFTPLDGAITVTIKQLNHHVLITICDSGIGISSDDLPHIFETFWRKDKAHSTPGFGLGLSIVKKIIEQYNGHIHIESEVGQGTDIHIELPLLQDD